MNDDNQLDTPVNLYDWQIQYSFIYDENIWSHTLVLADVNVFQLSNYLTYLLHIFRTQVASSSIIQFLYKMKLLCYHFHPSRLLMRHNRALTTSSYCWTIKPNLRQLMKTVRDASSSLYISRMIWVAAEWLRLMSESRWVHKQSNSDNNSIS